MKEKESVFTKIINHEIQAAFVFEDEVCVAIINKFPKIEGETLIIPKKQVDYIFDLDDQTYQHIFTVSKNISKALDKAFKTDRTCLVVEGFEIPHVHIKLYPVTGNKLEIVGGPEISDEEAESVAKRIKTHL